MVPSQIPEIATENMIENSRTQDALILPPTEKMSVADFLKGLPCHNAQNFSQFNTEQGLRTSQQRRPSVYLPTEDYPSDQHIVMDKRCVLLRYLTQQWDKKMLPRKRDHAGTESGTAAAGSAPGSAASTCKKRPRLDPVE